MENRQVNGPEAGDALDEVALACARAVGEDGDLFEAKCGGVGHQVVEARLERGLPTGEGHAAHALDHGAIELLHAHLVNRAGLRQARASVSCPRRQNTHRLLQ
ncbi:MAG: hypothetical protein IPN77_31645 [Sandaracinaceae bacterium]|nr:hypothetical protein [Sandaracinaceae bacterium]